MNGNWSGPQGGSATGATITSFRVWQLCGTKQTVIPPVSHQLYLD